MRDPRPGIPWSRRRWQRRVDYAAWMSSPDWLERRRAWLKRLAHNAMRADFEAIHVRPDYGPVLIWDALLLSVARSDSHSLVTALKSAGVPAVEIGEVLPPRKPLIQIY